MADKFLNETGLAYYHDRAKTIFENKIEKIKVNGTEQTITNKEVDLGVPIVHTEQMGDRGVDLAVIKNDTANDKSGLGVSLTDNGANITWLNESGSNANNINLASINYVDENGGKIDKIKINGVEQTITNKEVDLPITIEEAIAGGNTAIGNDKKIKIQNSSVGTIYAEHNVSSFKAVSESKNGSTISSRKWAELDTNGVTASFMDYDANTNTTSTVGYSGINISHIVDPEGQDPEVPSSFNLGINRTSGTPYVSMSSNFKEAFRTQLGIASAFTYKGSVATEADLPTTGNTVGDVYDVQDSGMNFAWDGTKWDALGSYVDTSLYWAKSELEAITTAEIDALFA